MIKKLLMAMAALVFYGSAAGQGVDFRDITFAEALELSAKENKPVFAWFHASSCGLSEYMNKEVFSRKEAGDYFNAKFINIEVDMQQGEGPGLSRQHNVWLSPAYLVFDAEGNEMHCVIGGGSLNFFIARIDSGVNPEKTMEALAEELRNGTIGKKDLTAYWLRNQSGGNITMEESQEIDKKLYGMLSAGEKASDLYWPLVRGLAMVPGSEAMDFILDNREAIGGNIGKEEVDGFIKWASDNGMIQQAGSQADTGTKAKKGNEYVVLVSRAAADDPEWNAVAEALRAKHDAALYVFGKVPREALESLRAERPRYVAIVELPENLNRDYIVDAHMLSREIDDDIYADYLWGVISAYDAAGAMRMVANSTEPLVIRDAVATIMETNSAKWFDRYGYVDDHTRGLWGEKKGAGQPMVTGTIDPGKVLRKFTDLYAEYDPDLLLTAAHATQKNLEMPFSLGNLRPRDGRLYAYDHFAGEQWDLPESGKRKVYFAIGNCLIGDFQNTRESMAPAWINGHNAAVMSGYVVETWHGRNGWGGLKYWLTTPGRYTLSEAVYLNQQDIVHQLGQWDARLPGTVYPHDMGIFLGRQAATETLTSMLGTQPAKDQIGFFHDRDVLAYYGDPKWDVRLQEIPEENDFTVNSKREGNKVTITIETKSGFNPGRMAGAGFKQEHVLDLPFSYFFPERLDNPRLAAGQPWNAAVGEDFLLIYEPGFEPGKQYTVVLEIN